MVYHEYRVKTLIWHTVLYAVSFPEPCSFNFGQRHRSRTVTETNFFFQFFFWELFFSNFACFTSESDSSKIGFGHSLLRSRFFGMGWRGALRDIPKNGCEGDYRAYALSRN